jgi:hypothetical protein
MMMRPGMLGRGFQYGVTAYRYPASQFNPDTYSNPGGISAEGASNATKIMTAPTGYTLYGYNFGFAAEGMPAAAEILGFEAGYIAMAGNTNRVQDFAQPVTVYLNANNGTNDVVSFGTGNVFLPTSLTERIFGGSGTIGSGATKAQVESTNFGLGIGFFCPVTDDSVAIDAFKMRVYWRAPL